MVFETTPMLRPVLPLIHITTLVRVSNAAMCSLRSITNVGPVLLLL